MPPISMPLARRDLGPRGPPSPGLPAMLAVGFVYWLAFLLSLEPGNVTRALRHGAALHASQETIRILGASLLGCAATPIPLPWCAAFPSRG